MENIATIDLVLLKWIHTSLSNSLLDFFCPIVRSKTTWIPLYIFLSYALYEKYPRQFWKIILSTAILIGFSDILCGRLLKEFFSRIRPCHIMEYSVWLNTFNHCSDTYSFPSCHAMNHSALAYFLGRYFDKKYYLLWSSWVLMICFSQVYIAVHYPSDVLFGSTIGVILAYLWCRISNSWINSPHLLSSR